LTSFEFTHVVFLFFLISGLVLLPCSILLRGFGFVFVAKTKRRFFFLGFGFEVLNYTIEN